jgi:hypothetical protein
MIIILALLLFLIVRIAIRLVVTSRRHFGAGGGVRRLSPAKRRTTAHGSGVVQEPNQPINVWTALDDIQLNRLLKDAAPRPHS